MILIVGNNADDILYFDARITNKRIEKIFNRYEITIGDISNQTVVLLKNIYTNVLSSAIVNYIIEKYFILFVIKIGKVETLSKEYKNGTILLSRKIVASDIDITDIQGTKLGQIPDFDFSYESDNELVNVLTNSFTKVTYARSQECTVISSNKHYNNVDELNSLIRDDTIINVPINEAIFDSELYGIALACSLHEIPFISVNVVLKHIGEKFDTKNYVNVLKQYVNVGKAVVNAISEIGSSEVLRG